MTLPSFLAASTNSGVIATAGGAAAITRVESAAPSASALDPASTSRRDNFDRFIGLILPLLFCRRAPKFSCGERPAPLRRQNEPDRAALRDIVGGGRYRTQLGAVGGLNHIVA